MEENKKFIEINFPTALVNCRLKNINLTLSSLQKFKELLERELGENWKVRAEELFKDDTTDVNAVTEFQKLWTKMEDLAKKDRQLSENILQDKEKFLKLTSEEEVDKIEFLNVIGKYHEDSNQIDMELEEITNKLMKVVERIFSKLKTIENNPT